MLVKSLYFGEITISDEDILNFPQGLPGFPEEKAFVILPYQPNSPFAFLQSVTEPNLAFLIVEPFQFFNNYEFTLPDDVVADYEFSESNLPLVYSIVTVPKKSEEMTANLLAPVIINQQKRIAFQLVLDKCAYTTKHRLFPQGLPQTKEGGE